MKGRSKPRCNVLQLCLTSMVVQGDGPIALVMAPTRELVVQIGKDINRFSRSANLRCVCVYGGTGVGSQVRPCQRLATLASWLQLRSLPLWSSCNNGRTAWGAGCLLTPAACSTGRSCGPCLQAPAHCCCSADISTNSTLAITAQTTK